MDHCSYPSCAVILTALPIEYQAVRDHVTDLQEEIHPEGTVYERGTFLAPTQKWEIGLVETRMGIARAAFEAGRAIDYFKPSVVFFVGVAGGIKDVKIGDVVAAKKVYGYESGKADTTFQPRPEVGNSTYRMVQRAQAEARSGQWLQRIKPAVSIEGLRPQAYVEPIAAGEKVLASTQSATWKFLRKQYGDAVAVEMEGYGFLQAVYGNQHVDALIVRGISDLIEGKSAADASGSQAIAACHASAFAFEVLSKLTEDGRASSSQPGPHPKGKPSRSSTSPKNQANQKTRSGNIIAPIGDNSTITINHSYPNKNEDKE
jgi:nucleoside phosphorylase